MVLIQALFEGFFVDEARVDVFDVRLHSLSREISLERSLRQPRIRPGANNLCLGNSY